MTVFYWLKWKNFPNLFKLDQKYLAPLFAFYDEKLHDKDEFIRKIQNDLNLLREEFQKILTENVSLHDRTLRATASSSSMNVKSTDVYAQVIWSVHDTWYSLHSSENIVRQAELVVEENKVLQDQLQLQTNRLTSIQKTQLEEGEKNQNQSKCTIELFFVVVVVRL